MDNISIFYTTTLGIEIAIFSIITAVIFVFMQLVYLNYSYKHLGFIFVTPLFIIFSISSVITFLFTAFGFLSIFLNKESKIQIFFSNIYIFIGILVMIIASISIFFLFVYKKFKFLQPSKALLLSGNNIKFQDLRLFLFKKYGIKSPEDLSFMDISRNYKYDLKETNQKQVNTNNIDTDELTTAVKKIKEQDPNYKIYLKKYKELKNKSNSAFNPLEPVNDIIFKSIVKLDIKTVIEARDIICKVIKNFVSDVPKVSNKEIWKPDNNLIAYFIDFTLESAEVQLEICDSQKMHALKLEIMEITKCLYLESIKNNNLAGLVNIFSFWKKIADDSINKNKRLFKLIISYYRDCCEKLFGDYDENSRYIENIFRDIGWIGERLLTKKDFEVKPLMMDLDYFNEYDELLELLLTFEDNYKEQPKSYPLIYFDAIDVIFLKLVDILLKFPEDYDIKNNLYSLSHVYFSFSIAAMENGNSRGAGLAVLRIQGNFEKLKEKNLENEAKDVLKLLVHLGAHSSEHKKSLKRVDFLGDTIEEFLINKITKEDSFIQTISAELYEVITKSYNYKNMDLIWGFIKKLGKKMHTNFNFRFNWENGEDYN